MDDINKIIGSNIGIQRRRQHMSQRELADQLSAITDQLISDYMVGSWERGTVQIPAAILPPICQVLRCSSYVLYPRSSTMSERDLHLMASLQNLSGREKHILDFLTHDWCGDSHALWEFGLLYAVLPESLRQDIAEFGIHTYKDARSSGDVFLDDRMEVDLVAIIRAWRKLHN